MASPVVSSSNSYVLPLHKFFVLGSVVAHLCTSSFHIFFGFPTGLRLLRLPSKILFVTVLSNILGICLARFIIWTCVYVTKSVSVQSAQYSIVPYFTDATFLYWSRYSKKDVFIKGTYCLWNIIGKRLLLTPKQKNYSDECFVSSNLDLTFDVFFFKRNAK
jgi:hypothetical protein